MIIHTLNNIFSVYPISYSIAPASITNVNTTEIRLKRLLPTTKTNFFKILNNICITVLIKIS